MVYKTSSSSATPFASFDMYYYTSRFMIFQCACHSHTWVASIGKVSIGKGEKTPTCLFGILAYNVHKET